MLRQRLERLDRAAAEVRALLSTNDDDPNDPLPDDSPKHDTPARKRSISGSGGDAA